MGWARDSSLAEGRSDLPKVTELLRGQARPPALAAPSPGLGWILLVTVLRARRPTGMNHVESFGRCLGVKCAHSLRGVLLLCLARCLTPGHVVQLAGLYPAELSLLEGYWPQGP